MKNLIFLFMVLVTGSWRLQAQNKVITLNDAAMFILYLKANKVDIYKCSDDFIIYAWNFLGNGKTDFTDEFAKKRYATKAKDSIMTIWGKYHFTDTYTYTAVRLFGTYDFDRDLFPILEDNQINVMTGGLDHSIRLNSYKTEATINGSPLELQPQEMPPSFDFSLHLTEHEAEKFISEKDSMFQAKVRMDPGYKNAVFFDALGNKITGKDRRIFLKYYVKILNKEDPYFSENVYDKDVYAVIQKIEAYIDKDYRRLATVIYQE